MTSATQNETDIRDAISRSMSHTEIANVTIDESDIGKIHELVAAATMGEWDYSQEDRNEHGQQVLDVYGIGNGDEMTWRIKVTFAA